MVGGRKGRGICGFTLIELMMVAAIVGIIAAIAIPRFINNQLRSKTAEVKSNLNAIFVAEEAFFAEAGNYLTIAPEPPAIPGATAVPFNGPGSGFAQISWEPEGRVYFSYGVTASADGLGYTVDAGADLDVNGVVQFWGVTKPDGVGAVPPGQVGCNSAALIPLEIGPCDPTAGRSTF